MAIERWMPRRMRRQGRWDWPETGIESLIADVMQQPSRLAGMPAEETGIWSPDIDIVDKQNELVVHADLPGIDKDNIAVEVEDGRLTLRGERREEKSVEQGDYCCTERWHGSFERSLTLPSNVSAKDVKANFKDGVLEVHLPKTEHGRGRKVKID